MIALIDGDEVAYKVALSYQQTWYSVYKDDKYKWKYKHKADAAESIGNRDDLEIKVELEVFEPTDLKEKINTIVSAILFNTNSTDLRFYLSGHNNFRYDFATLLPYKGNREGGNRPFHLTLVKEELRERGAELLDFLEADDLLSANDSLIQKPTVICSTDKDLRTVPSLNYNITTKLLQRITPEVASFNFWKQILIGDPTDNIPSPYGLGEVGADEYLSFIWEKLLKSGYTNLDRDYYQAILPFYRNHLSRRDKKGNLKTKWYDAMLKRTDGTAYDSVEGIILEVGNLLWMHRTLDPEERWVLPV